MIGMSGTAIHRSTSIFRHLPAVEDGSRPAKSELVRAGLAYWHRIRRDRPMPSRTDLSPMDIPDLLPYVMLIDVWCNPLDFSFRLLGTEHDQIVGGDYRGRRFSSLAHTAPGNPIWDQYAQVVADRRPVWGEVSYVGRDEQVLRRFEHALMPLSCDGATVDLIFVVSAIDRTVSSALPLSKRIVLRRTDAR